MIVNNLYIFRWISKLLEQHKVQQENNTNTAPFLPICVYAVELLSSAAVSTKPFVSSPNIIP